PSSLSSHCSAYTRHPHSFPTRRSSDLQRQDHLEDDRGHHQGRAVVGEQRRHRRPEDDDEVEQGAAVAARPACHVQGGPLEEAGLDRKSTRLNSSHVSISYAVFCLKKKT